MSDPSPGHAPAPDRSDGPHPSDAPGAVPGPSGAGGGGGPTLVADRSGPGPGPAGSRFAAWWSTLGRGQRAAFAVVAAIVVANVALAGAGSVLGGDPGGPVSSSFSTGGDGLEAYADLLRGAGHPVDRMRDQVTAADLDDVDVAVLADPTTLAAGEAEALLGFASAGGRLVLAGGRTSSFLSAATGSSIEWERAEPVDEVDVWLPDALGGAEVLTGDAGGRWSSIGPLIPLAGADGVPTVVTAEVGSGEVIALADASPLHNRYLGAADNAALALGLAATDQGSPGRVLFVESAHGFAGGGLDAVPPSWKWAAAGLALALVVGLWAAGSRFGPPEPARRALRPPRRDHVEAVAADLERVVRAPADAVAPLAETTRRALADRLGVPHDASPAVLRAAADAAGVDPHHVELLSASRPDLGAALAIGVLAARRQRSALGSEVTGPPVDRGDAGTVPADRRHPGAQP